MRQGRAIATVISMLLAEPVLAQESATDAPSQAEPIQACDSCSARKQSLKKMRAARAEETVPEAQAPQIQAQKPRDTDQ